MFNLIKDNIGVGTNKQLENLMARKDDATIQELFRLMLCPSIVYNIKKVPDVSNCTHDTRISTNDELVGWLESLVNADLRGAALKSAVSNIFCHSTEDLAEVFTWILDRKNPAKIGVSLVNKVWPGLIRTQDYMGAVPGTQEALDRLFQTRSVNAQIKEDGMALLVDYVDGKAVSGRSRQGNDVGKYFPYFMGNLMEVPEFNGMVHMELLCASLDRKEGNGLINKQITNGIIGGRIDHMLRAVLLDLRDDNFPNLIQDSRYNKLFYFTSLSVARVYQTSIYTIKEARKLCMKVISEGGEGLVLKDPNMPFKNGKPWYNVKLKNEFPCTLVCVGTNPHSKHADLIGSLVMESLDGLLQVNVNPRCEADRNISADEWVGHVFQVKAESVTQPKSNIVQSLYLPRFDGECYDEYHRIDTNANTLDEILKEELMSRQMK